VPDLAARFPSAVERCRELGLDLASTPVPVAPAAHYSMGGVLTDTWGRTSVPRLFACGEVACTGVHGANRLASNSLAEALVFGRRAALADDGPSLAAAGASAPLGSDPVGALALATIRDLADRFLGVRRNGPELEALLDRLTSRDPDGDRAVTLVAWSIAAAASRREESRGGHLRVDFPTTRDRWRVRQAVGRSGWTTEPVRGDAPTWSAV
jgi:L-aspartate oxidase